MDDAPRDPDAPGVGPLDRLLRPPDRTQLWRAALDRLRGLDRGLVVMVGAVVLLAAVAAGVVLSRSGPSGQAAVTLPRARSSEVGATSGGQPSAAADAATTDPGAASSGTTTTTGGVMVIDVAGAVVHPGLVTVPAGARVADAIAAAGGFRPDADGDRLNLASPVGDGTRIYVAAAGQSSIPMPIGPTGGAASDGATTGSTVPAPVDLNTATADQLDGLPGVGPSTAQAILSYRTSHGSFASVDDLDQVRGIGPAKLSQLRDLVTVG